MGVYSAVSAGFDLGFDRAGMRCAWQVEYDAKARAVLARHWPDVERFEDVRNVGRDKLGPVDVICGGFPCQDVSVAGNRAGLAGERSGLWFEFHRILDELSPAWVVIENVPGLLSSNGGRDFATILRGLVKLRYGVTWRVLDSQYFGVAQRRRRVFIVGSLGNGRSAEVLFERDGLFGNPPARREQREGVTSDVTPSLTANGDANSGFRDEKGLVVSTVPARDYGDTTYPIVFQQNQRNEVRDLGGVVGALQAQSGMKQQNYLAYSLTTEQTPKHSTELAATLTKQSPTGGGQPQAVVYSANAERVSFRARRLTPTECCRLQAFPDGHTSGQSDTTRYTQLGNAVTVSVAEWIGKRIIQLRKESTDDVQLA